MSGSSSVGSFDGGSAAGATAGLPTGCFVSAAPVPYLEALALMRGADLLLVIDAPADSSVFLPEQARRVPRRAPADRRDHAAGTAADLTLRLGGLHADPAEPEAVAAALAAGLTTVAHGSRREWGDRRAIDAVRGPAVAPVRRTDPRGSADQR